MVALNPINNNAAEFRDPQIGTPVRHFYYTNQWQRIEERHELDNTLSLHAQWLPGARYIDDYLLRDVVANPGNATIDADQRKYYLSDANWNTVAIVGKTSTGPDVWATQERYAYQPYGMPVYLESDFSTKTTQESDYAVENLFQGLTKSAAIGLDAGRNRYLVYILGQWSRRDPVGYIDSHSLVIFEGASPNQNLDPYGLLLPRSQSIEQVHSAAYLTCSSSK